MVSCYACSIFGIGMSLWAILQLTAMGFFYSTEVTTLLEDIEPHSSEYNGYDDFLAKCTKNYKTVAFNCFIVAYFYVFLCLFCLIFMLRSRSAEIKSAKVMEDDDLFCNPQPPKERKKKSIK